MSPKDTLEKIKENSTTAQRMFIPSECRQLDALMVLTDEFEELETQMELFDLDQTYWAGHQQNYVCRRCQEEKQHRERAGPGAACICAKPCTSLP
ncbi:GM11696 [Drosophila sechellia]|uniref:GM11696 n=1 Tax=Drosophila sechellia TaxID=7238 RepID=B4IL08_DROSE|nr:GM11696 [Drosophila sechellia]